MEKDVRKIEIFLVLAIVGTFFFLGSSITGFVSYVTNYSYEDNKTIRNNTVVDVFVYDTRLDTINLSQSDGIVGEYYVFDGTLDRFTSDRGTGGIPLFNSTTLLGWYKRITNRLSEGLIKIENVASTNISRVYINSTGGLVWGYTGQSDIEVCDNVTAMQNDTWIFWAITFNESQNNASSTYCNGVLTNTVSTNRSHQFASRLNVSYKEIDSFTGKMDEIQLFQRALNSTEINDIYTRNLAGLVDNVTNNTYLALDEGTLYKRRLAYFDGSGWLNQHDPHGIFLIGTVTLFFNNAVPYDDAYFTTSNWRNNTGATWYEEGWRSFNGRYYTNNRVTNINTGNGTTGQPEFDLRAGGTMSSWVYRNSITSTLPNTFSVFYHSNLTQFNSSQGFWMDSGATNNNIACVFKTINGTESNAAVNWNNPFDYYGWHLWTCTFDGTTRRLYYDGALVTNSTLGSASFRALMQYPLRIGRAYDGDGNRVLYGSLDETKLYDRPLTADEIASDYTRGLAGLKNNITDGLLLYYNYEDWCNSETTINCIKDGSGNGRDGEFHSSDRSMVITSRGSQREFPEIATIVCTTQGVSIFNASGDFWGSYRTVSTGTLLGNLPKACSMRNGVLCVAVTDGVRCLDFKADKTLRWQTGGVATGFNIGRGWESQTYTTASGVGLAVSSNLDVDMTSINNDTLILACGSTATSIINLTGHTTWDDTITSGSKCKFTYDNTSLIYKDGNSLALKSGLPTADFTPTFTTAFSNIQAIASNDTRVYVGNSTDLFSYSMSLSDGVNHTNLLNGVNNVTNLKVLASRWLWVSTAPQGNVSEINLSSNTTRTSLFDIFPSRNFTALSVYVNDSSGGELGAYEGCESSGLVAVGFNESGASLVNWTGLYCTNESPTIDQVVLASNSTYNLTTGNLSLSFVNVTDREGDAVMNITDWRVNGTSIAVVYLPFEGGSNSTFTKDYTTYKNNGSVDGAVFNNFGGFDTFGAYEFDGLNDNITLAAQPNLTDGFTFMAWVKRFSDSNDGSTHDIFNNNQFFVRAGPESENSGNVFEAFVKLNDSSVEPRVGSGVAAIPNQWFHITVTWNLSTLSIYVNGSFKASSSRDDNLTDNVVAAQIGMGEQTSLTLGAWNGSIDDVRFYNRVLSYDQIVRIYSNQTNVTVHNETMRGEVWSACVTPNDRVQDGAEVCSNDLEILNTPPSIDEVQLNSSNGDNLTDEDLILTLINVTDDDDDEVKNISDWQLYNGSGFESIALVNLPFEGGSNSTITRDYSTFKRNGTVSSAVFNSTGGFDGFGAYVFNGASRTISVPFSANLSNQYTISFWVNTTNNETGQIQGVVSIGNSSHDLRLFINPSSMEFDIFPGEIGNLASPIERNEWKFYAAVWDGSSSYLYEDGVLITTSSANMSFPGASSLTLSWPVNEYLNGSLDEVRVFNRSLSSDQIELLYNNDVLTLSSYETRAQQVWQGCVTPNDRTNDGPTVCSNNLTVDTVTIDIEFLKGTLDCTMAIYQDFDEATFYTCGDVASVNGVIECDLGDDGNSSLTIPTTSSSCDIGNPNYGAIVVYNNGTNVSLNVSLLNLTVGGIENAVMQIDTYIFNAVSAPGCNGASCNNCPSADTTGCFLDLNSTTSEPNSTIECDHFKRDSAVCECFSIHVEDADTVHQLKNGSQVSFVVQKTAVPEPPEVCS